LKNCALASIAKEPHPKAFHLALECRWLPEAARAENPEWQGWIEELLEGRFSRVGLEDSCIPDPYLFVPFPVPAERGKDDVVEDSTKPSHERKTAPKAEEEAPAPPVTSKPDTEVDPVVTERASLIAAFKAKARAQGFRATDARIAKAANPKWNDRTMVTWWKSNDVRCKLSHDRKIRAVLARDPFDVWPTE
jgi:hypothetical protein